MQYKEKSYMVRTLVVVISAIMFMLVQCRASAQTLSKQLQIIDTTLAAVNSSIIDKDTTLLATDSQLLAKDTTLMDSDLSLLDNDTTLIASDSTLLAIDTTGSALKKGNIDMPVFSQARDSIIEDISGARKMIYYYGDVTVSFQNMELKSDYMAYDVDSKTVFAKGLPDTTGVIVGNPVMKQGDDTFEMESVYYNFNSQKAKIRNMITQEEDGFLHGSYIKKMPDNSINISKGKYTTCDCDHPHFYLQMTTAKVINSPDGTKKTVFGPAYVVVEDVPTPFALPFGFVPKFSDRSGGILIPTYGEETARGFFLKGLGYYFVLGDHMDLSATADIYTMGSWGAQLNSRYSNKYKFSGDLAVTYSVDQTGEKGSSDFFQSKNFSFRWSHSQDAKARPGTSFRASVNFSSPSNNKYNNNTIQQGLQNQISSSISYSKNWAGTPFSMSVNALHSQNSRDSSYSVTLPNFTFTMNRIYPFKRKNRVGEEKFYESFAFNYNTSFENRISFKASEVGEPDFFQKMKNGMKHNFSIGLPSFTLAKYIQASPSVTYGMNWFFTDIEKTFNQETQEVETIYSQPFSTFGVTQNYSAGISLSTRLYGMFNFGKKRSIEAIRHMVTPSLNIGYQPDLGTAANGYTSLTYVDATGQQRLVPYNRYENQIYSAPGRGQSASMGFSLNNNLEAKVRDLQDTTGTGTKKVKLLDQLNFSGNYNFLADSLNLSNISVSLSTTIFGKMGLSASANLDPYAIDAKGKKIGTYNIVQEGGLNLFRLTSANMSMAYSFSGEGKSRLGSDYKPEDTGGFFRNAESNGGNPKMYQKMYYHPVTGEYIPGGWVYYVDPNIPWSVSLSYSYSYSRSYQYANNQLQVKNNHMQTLGVSGQLRLTDQLNFSLSSGLDLSKMAITTTQLSATYDLHCFQISVSWVPNGQWESWSFRINAKASALADLLQYKKNASYWDN